MDMALNPKTPRSLKPLTVKTEVMALHLAGRSNLDIAAQLGMSKNTVTRILQEGKLGADSKISIESTFNKLGLTHETVGAKFQELMNSKDTRLASFEGKFTDRVDVPDGAVQFRAAEAVGKILGMFPREDASATAALFVRLPNDVIVAGHPATCMCDECARTWENENTIDVSP